MICIWFIIGIQFVFKVFRITKILALPFLSLLNGTSYSSVTSTYKLYARCYASGAPLWATACIESEPRIHVQAGDNIKDNSDNVHSEQ